MSEKATAVPPEWPGYRPGSDEVARLIEAALSYPGGVRFLVEGELGAVSAVFKSHAFAVEAARTQILREGR